MPEALIAGVTLPTAERVGHRARARVEVEGQQLYVRPGLLGKPAAPPRGRADRQPRGRSPPSDEVEHRTEASVAELRADGARIHHNRIRRPQRHRLVQPGRVVVEERDGPGHPFAVEGDGEVAVAREAIDDGRAGMGPRGVQGVDGTVGS